MYSLEVIKGGVSLETIPLTNPVMKLGRQPDTNDIILDHESCSRNHAKLLLEKKSGDSEVCLYIIDLGSTHGTFLNKTRLEPRIDTRLDNGYQIKFAESTRIFVVVKDEPEDDQEYKTTQSLPTTVTTDPQISWGFREDAIGFDEEEDSSDIGLSMLHGKVSKGRGQSKVSWLDALDATQLNEKEQAIFDRLLSLKLKSENLSNEISRIRSKEDKFGERSLTEGQMKQIAKNEVAIDSIKERIACDTDALKKKLADRRPELLGKQELDSRKGQGEKGEGGVKSLKRLRGIEDDLDDGFDAIHDAVERDAKISGSKLLTTTKTSGIFKIRTSGGPSITPSSTGTTVTQIRAPSGSIETASSLKIKLVNVQKAIETLEREAEMSTMSREHQDESSTRVEDDPLDAFMQRMTSVQFQQAEALSSKRNDQLNALRREEARLNDLVHVVTTSSLQLQSLIPENFVERIERVTGDKVEEEEERLKALVGPQLGPHHNRQRGGGVANAVAQLLQTQSKSKPPPPPRLFKQPQSQEKRQEQLTHNGERDVEVEEGLTAKVALPSRL